MPNYNVRFDIADVRYIAFEKFCKKHNIEFSIQPLLQQCNVSGSLPLRLETTKNGQSIVDANLKGVIIATANRSEWADEIARRWNMVTDVGGNDR